MATSSTLWRNSLRSLAGWCSLTALGTAAHEAVSTSSCATSSCWHNWRDASSLPGKRARKSSRVSTWKCWWSVMADSAKASYLISQPCCSSDVTSEHFRRKNSLCRSSRAEAAAQFPDACPRESSGMGPRISSHEGMICATMPACPTSTFRMPLSTGTGAGERKRSASGCCATAAAPPPGVVPRARRISFAERMTQSLLPSRSTSSSTTSSPGCTPAWAAPPAALSTACTTRGRVASAGPRRSSSKSSSRLSKRTSASR
mmetsp:Transcript_104519/g.272915  ORF Transcript_104519/g.272915 Transcript_104519/m.272915 type:complete len:259 (-) Transcript_104519:1659-2435(-)